ncbi:GNAT family N-acetyltransferase [Xanthomonas theicola]|uniref:GNAT family N-acetyltransferase n=1 Tax=Xanthomonas theicola TaxID=56464 RepID=A0A2S6ZJG4_9XANT|nr:GNAT family protein [Xanthomonas theicola]PPT92401.1 GNAT family N-acetyltransferase [Xanthomonas theicola]QNH25119.1 GNAT family N-acetyltransferase [Xanthomonas theicola]
MSDAAGATVWRDLQLHAGSMRLRRWRDGDLDALLRHAGDAQAARGFSTRFPHPCPRADGEAFLDGCAVDLRHPVLAIEIDGEACGGIALRPVPAPARRSAELGDCLGRAHWVKGHMPRIVAAYQDWAVPVLGLRRVETSVLDSNLASARVLQKNGFVEEGMRCSMPVRPGQVYDLCLFGRHWPVP